LGWDGKLSLLRSRVGWASVQFFGFFEEHEISARYDIPLSTAVGLSAGFTAVAPAGYHIDFEGPDKSIYSRSQRFVDGGYIDSGVETATSAAQMIISLQEADTPSDQPDLSLPEKLKFEVRILMIGSVGQGYLAKAGLNELASPVAAMYNTRIQRAERTINSISQYHPESGPVSMAWEYFTPPLGWFISPYTIETIGDQMGTPERGLGPVDGDFAAK
jgi:hypothetical protein